jgi:hypothetical protein
VLTSSFRRARKSMAMGFEAFMGQRKIINQVKCEQLTTRCVDVMVPPLECQISF